MYAYENPDDPFPDIVEGAARFEGEQLGHPLLPRRTCVRNDVRLGEGSRVLMRQRLEHVREEHASEDHRANAALALAGDPFAPGGWC